jgi:hypothetical protein
MKMNLKNNTVLRQSFCWVAAFACLFLALSIVSFKQSETSAAVGIQKQALMDKLRDTNEQNKLIQLLNSGQTDAAKKLLNQQLAYNLTLIDSLTPATDANSKVFAKIVKTEIARDERAHPGYYLASIKRGNLNGAAVVQMVRH